jgi:nucleotidyltransferase substrate binding protein (TIGR01987 family)
MPLDLSSFKNAVEALRMAVGEAQNPDFMDHLTPLQQDIVYSGVIQHFEFTFELAWKMIGRWLSHNVSPEIVDTNTKKDLFRLAARKNLVHDPKRWFEYNELRNRSSHTYDAKLKEKAFKVIIQFLSEVTLLLAELEARND